MVACSHQPAWRSTTTAARVWESRAGHAGPWWLINGVEPSGAAVFEAVLGREELFFPFLKGNSTLVKTAGGPARAGGGLEELRKGVEWCASAMTKVVTPWDIIA